ncbi:MAG: PIN domain-containing protein [Spirochaetes bacterium]|nr:PIN domain-containing protein [Spirochaetota bacterium]
MTAVLVDTSIYSAFKRGETEVVDRMRRFGELHLNTVVIGEILSGFRRGTKERENRRELDAFLDSPRLRLDPLTLQTAEFYSYVYQQLRSEGTPIPTNDMWIAATALEHGLAVYTRDAHFAAVPGLLVLGIEQA